MAHLYEKAMLVHLQMTKWSARKLDRGASLDIMLQNGADPDSGRFWKSLVKKSHLEDIQSIISEARAWHLQMTLPWSDAGFRLLPAYNFWDYTSGVDLRREKFLSKVEAFLEVYEDAKEQARSYLNGLFQAADYPDVDSIRSKFSFDVDYMQMPNTDDFRLELSQNETDKVKRQIEERTQGRIREAHRAIYYRLLDMAKNYVKIVGETQRQLKDATINNLKELADLVPNLNMLDDPELTKLAQQLRKIAELYDPDTLRKNKRLRESVAQEAKQSVNQIEQTMRGIF